MRCPHAPGSPIDAKRYKRWVSQYGSYRTQVSDLTIQNWLSQFDSVDQDLAGRILDSVEYYGQAQIHAAYRQALTALDGWDPSHIRRRGKWRFAAMSGSAGESGDAMLYQFRIANNLDSRPLNELLVSRSDLFRMSKSPNDVVVLLDDFTGTGRQVCDAWNDPETSFGSLLAGVGKVYLIVVAASKAAQIRISAETDISLMPAHRLNDADNVFSDHCKHFSKADRAKLVHYGKIANKKHPKGFDDCGFVVVFQHRTPNNSIPILHADHSKWTGIFPRHD